MLKRVAISLSVGLTRLTSPSTRLDETPAQQVLSNPGLFDSITRFLNARDHWVSFATLSGTNRSLRHLVHASTPITKKSLERLRALAGNPACAWNEEDSKFLEALIQVTEPCNVTFDALIDRDQNVYQATLLDKIHLNLAQKFLKYAMSTIGPVATAHMLPSDTRRICQVAVRLTDDPENAILKYGHSDIHNNRFLILLAVRRAAWAIQYADFHFRDDPEIILAALKNDGLRLGYTAKSIKNNPEIVLAAVKYNGLHLKHASKALQDHRLIVVTAINSDRMALKFASERLKNNRELILETVKTDGWALEYASVTLKDDPEIVMAAVMRDGGALMFASVALRDDPDIVLAAISRDRGAFQFASWRLQSDPEILAARRRLDRSRRLPPVLSPSICTGVQWPFDH